MPQVLDPIARVLSTARNIAVVGLSDDPLRPSYGVSEYMQQQGYRILPVNPTIASALGEISYPTLFDVPEKIDIVNVFRQSSYVPEIVEEAIKLKAPVLWLQEGVIHEQAAERARQAGIQVFMNLCILKEHQRIFL